MMIIFVSFFLFLPKTPLPSRRLKGRDQGGGHAEVCVESGLPPFLEPITPTTHASSCCWFRFLFHPRPRLRLPLPLLVGGSLLPPPSMAEASVVAPADFQTSSTLSFPSSLPPPPPHITSLQPASAAKSILKRRFSCTEDSPEDTRKDSSLWFEGKKLRFGSESAPSPSSTTAPAEEETHHQEEDLIMEEVETVESVGLDEGTRKQMALMGKEGKGAGRRKVRGGGGKDEGTDQPEPEVVAEVAGLKDSLSKLERFTKDSEEVSLPSFLFFRCSISPFPSFKRTRNPRAELSASSSSLPLPHPLLSIVHSFTLLDETSNQWSDILRPLLGPPPSSNPDSRRHSFNSDTSSPNSSSNDLLEFADSPSRLPSVPEILNSPLLGPHFPPVFVDSAARRRSGPDPVSRSSAAAVTLASLAANPTTHRGISPAPFSPSSSPYLLAKATANSAPCTPGSFTDPTLHLAPIGPLAFSLPPSPIPYTRSNLSGSVPPEARRPSLSHPSRPHATSLPNVPTRRTSTSAPDEGPSASHLLNQLRRHSNPASTFSAQTRRGSISGGGAKELLRRYSTIVREKLETWEGLESLVKDAEEVREDWDAGMAKV